MADNRKYYYLKLKENFFDSDSIVLLEDMKDGILYSNKGAPPSLPPKGSRCDGCSYWRGIGCVFCYREQLTPKTGGKNEP